MQSRSPVDRRVVLKTLGLMFVCGLTASCGPGESPGEEPTQDLGRRWGPAQDLGVNETTYFNGWIVMVCRDTLGYYALSSFCTHQGCNVGTTNDAACGYDPTDLSAGFRCCCHDALYAADGTVISGPAPYRLIQLLLTIDEAGDLWVKHDEVPLGTRV